MTDFHRLIWIFKFYFVSFLHLSFCFLFFVFNALFNGFTYLILMFWFLEF
ncbi:putative membrane protein [Helicobacter pylori Hp H-28]|nr:putative membrane protein [Helicobacter pylori Hp H-28]